MSETNAQNLNTQRLLNQLHNLSDVLTGRSAAGKSIQVVPAPEDDGQHRLAQRRLVEIATMLHPVAHKEQAWSQAIGEIAFPVAEQAEGQKRVLNAKGMTVDIAQGSVEISREAWGWVQNQTGGQLSPEGMGLTVSSRGANDIARRALALEDVASWEALTVPYEREHPGRGTGSSYQSGGRGRGRANGSGASPEVEAFFPMSFVRRAVAQIWVVIEELDLGIPYDGPSPHDTL
ncbi:hypothetical protein ABSL23_17395 (plasmid) [Halobacterium sp. NMX12-1]|uniref:Uncharacterized protein n=1 Tax=Halobacterium sp. NMX12-1 TaxID=3166650 RepID=A0AAU8CJS8_9EURY